MSSLVNSVDTSVQDIESQSDCKTEQSAMSAVKSRGAFIVFEGIDRCGKSSQCKKLLTYLSSNNIKNKFYRFPNRDSLTGVIINDYLTNKIKTLDDRCIHLLFAANRHESKQAIIDDLNAGINIICDRYSYSGIAYSSSKEIAAQYTQNMSLKWCSVSESGLPKPDCVLYLNLSVDDAQKRGSFGAERYEKTEFQKKVKSKFDEIIKNEQRNNRYTAWNVIDANRDMDSIHKQIVDIVDQTMQRVSKTGKDIELYAE